MHTTMMKGAAIALLAAAMGMAGNASAHAPPSTPCNSANAWEVVYKPIHPTGGGYPYEGWDLAQYTCVPGEGWYFSAYCNSWTNACFYY